MMEYSDYEAQAHTVRVEDITENQRERGILQKIIFNELSSLNIGPDIRHDFDYCPTNAHDLGWLGYFIGKNTQIREVEMGYPTDYFDEDDMLPFFRGLSYNKSIEELIFWHLDFSGGSVFRTLIPFFQGDQCLTKFEINQCNLEDEGCRLLPLALGGCNSLQHFDLYNCGVTDSQSVNIIEALGGNAQLESIQLSSNSIGRAGCAALAKLFQLETTNVQNLALSNNSIDDGGMEALMPALAKNSNLRELNLAENNGITGKGWPFLLKLICNTFSINATYLSNHTLESVGDTYDGDLNRLLLLNGSGYPKQQIAMMKILKYHNNFDLQPLFEWDFKVLPCILEWFERAAECLSDNWVCSLPDLEGVLQRRKLSAIYQFIRGMPLDFIEARATHELKEVAARKKRLNSELEEMENRKKRLRDELEEAKDLERRMLRSRMERTSR